MRKVLTLAATLALGAAACNAILGIEDQRLRDDAGVLDDGAASADVDTSALDDAGDARVPSAYELAVLEDKPIVYLRFGEAQGASVAVDEMKTLDGTYPSPGKPLDVTGAIANDPNTALELGGISALTFPPGVDFQGKVPFSVELWIRRDASGASGFVIDNQSYPPSGWSLYADGNGIYFERRGSGGVTASGAVNGLPDTEWHHVVGTWTGEVHRLYVDGKLSEANASTATISREAGGFKIGGQNCECTTNFFRGGLDELAFYDSALTPVRIDAHLRAARAAR
jgi:trimeric autotransporter adhesin